MNEPELYLDQVWRHRRPCRACRGEHRHRYRIIGLPKPGTVMVRELDLVADVQRAAGPAPLPARIFGSHEKGGLELIGYWRNGKIIPVDHEVAAA